MEVKERNLALNVVLTIVTCGIYGWYWLACLQDDTNAMVNDYKTSGVMAAVLTIVTCSIYGLYWAYKMGEKIDNIKTSKGMPSSNSGVLYLILMLVGGGVISYALMQYEVNKLVQN